MGQWPTYHKGIVSINMPQNIIYAPLDAPQSVDGR